MYSNTKYETLIEHGKFTQSKNNNDPPVPQLTFTRAMRHIWCPKYLIYSNCR